MAIGFKTNSVETRLVGVLLMLTVLPTITVGWIAHEILLDHIKTEKLVDMGRVAEAKHDQLSMVLSRANGRADLFLSDLAAQCGFGTLDRTCAARLMRSYLIAENALSATLHLKGSGGPLTVGSRAVRHDADPKFNAGQLAAFDGQGPEGNRVYFIRATEQISGLRLEISYPSSSLQSIFDRPEELGESGETFLADGRGYFVTQARYPTTQGVNDPINTAPYQACLGGGSGEMLDLDYRNAKVIHGFRPVPELGSACIMAHIGQAEAFAPLRKLEKDWLVASMLFLAFALVVARNVSRRIANPLINLTKIASAYTQGHYTAQADVKGRNEIAELASAFNSMTYQLTSANDLLAEKVVELEEARAGMARTNRALKMQLLCNIKLVYADAEDTLLEEVCKLIVNAGGYRMAWVGFAQHDEEYTVLPAAQSGFDEGYLESLRITWSDTELGQGPTGAAIRTGATQINQDFQTNAPMTPWRESALARGYRSSIALPLRNGGETFGALTIYSEEADAFNSGEAGLLEDLANELAFGILMQRLRVRNKQAEEALQRSEEKFRLVVEHIPMRIFIKDINSVYVSCNELCARDWGLAPSAIAGMTDFDFHPRELAKQYRADDERVMRSGQTVEIERKYLIGGKELFAHTIKVPFRDKDGRMVGVLGILWDVTERKLAEERLRRSEHDLAEAQSMAHLGSWSLDLISNELTWSDENYRIFGFERGEFGASYEAFLDVVHPDDREFVNQAYTSSLKDRKPYDIVHRLLMKDGRVKYVNERCETYYSDAGEPVRSIGTTHDITQLKLVEQNLLAVQNELTSTLNAIPDLLFEIGLDGRYYSYRSPRTDLLAAPPEQLIGSLVSDVLPPEASAVCLAALQEANEAGHSSGRQFELKLGEEIKWFELSIARKTREKTDDPRFIVISRDITERKRVEQSLLTLYKAIDQSPISVIITDADARIQYINPHFTTMSGYTAAEVLGKNPSMFKSEQTPDEVYADMWSKISSGQIWHGELLNKNKSGQLYSEETHIAPVMDAAGKVSQYVCLKIDNSERIEAEEKLAESYLELQRLSSHLEHLREDERAKIARDLHDEMGALLVALKMRVAWLASKLPADMPLLTEETGHISTLTADLISSMHQIVTELRPNLQEGFGFVATFEDYVKKFQQRTGIECRFALPEEEMKLDTNRAVSLFRILQESLNNVEKYSMAKRVKILLTAKNDSLSLVVEDNGVGFDPAMRKKGSFGLIGIRERTAMMGGKAKISSTPGKGTKVSVTLPQV